jgi:VWFA-related protein
MVLITDGVDNASKLTVAEAIALARSGTVPIYTIGLAAGRPEGRRKADIPATFQVLEQYSRETGGTLFTVRDPDDVKEAAAQILEDLRHQYVIGYTPQFAVWDGRFRRIRVESLNPRLEIRARTGYFATP